MAVAAFVAILSFDLALGARQAAQGQARRNISSFKKDSVPSFQARASSLPICWMLFGSSRIWRTIYFGHGFTRMKHGKKED